MDGSLKCGLALGIVAAEGRATRGDVATISRALFRGLVRTVTPKVCTEQETSSLAAQRNSLEQTTSDTRCRNEGVWWISGS